MKRALVTGGAGLIGSHVADLLRQEGWWVRSDENFIEGDVCDSATLRAALDGIDLIFHQAAYGGYMPEIAKYVAVNSFGTAQMLEMIREEKLPIRKVIVASSQAVYSEGAGRCPSNSAVAIG